MQCSHWKPLAQPPSLWHSSLQCQFRWATSRREHEWACVAVAVLGGFGARRFAKRKDAIVCVRGGEDGFPELAQQLDTFSYDVMDVPVRSGQNVIKLKRHIDKNGVMKHVQSGLPAPPSILVLHDGPGLPSRYLEPLAARLCSNGRSCYMYDQLGCGLSAADDTGDLPLLVKDLHDVMLFLKHSLAEDDLHVVAHGAGGALLMEGLVRHWSKEGLPKLRSICLLSVSSSTAVADAAAAELMTFAAESVGVAEAPRAFWYRHVCALKPQPSCLADAYQQAAGPRWGALRGFAWKETGWQLRGQGALDGWSLKVAELRRFACSWHVPVLSLRGQHDFVTEECVASWHALARLDGTGFSEGVLGGCGHNAHLEAPDSVAASLRLWLLDVEDEDLPPVACGAPAKPPNVKCRVLRRDEARTQLHTWASQLSWASTTLPAKPGSWRSVGQGLPHRDAFAPSRTCRRLADWASQLPRSDAVSEEVINLRDLLAGASSGPVALALMDGGLQPSTCGIDYLLASVGGLQVCIERKPLQLVGIACNPSGGKSLCDDAVDEIEAAIKSSK